MELEFKFRSMYQGDEEDMDYSGVHTNVFEGTHNGLMSLHFVPEGLLRDEFEER